MPNHIKNRISLEGTTADIKLMLKNLSTHYSEPGTDPWTRFPDFEKVYPCPQVIKDVGEITIGIASDVKQYFQSGGANQNVEKPCYEDQKDNEKFNLALKAYSETGAAYWYDWNRTKWGTKWNAYECEQKGESVFEFQTAWVGVPRMIMEISAMHPDVVIKYEYADEDMGSNVGSFVFIEGECITDNSPESRSNKAYELAFKLWPECRDGYKIVDGTYVFVDDED